MKTRDILPDRAGMSNIIRFCRGVVVADLAASPLSSEDIGLSNGWWVRNASWEV